MEKRNSTKSEIKVRDELRFRCLPEYARFLRDNRLRDFVREQLSLMFRWDFPLFRFYDLSSFDEEELIDRSLPAYIEFLDHAINNTLTEHISHGLAKWLNNELPEVHREQLVTEDITLATYTRKKALCAFISEYTRDVQEALEIIDEIERYCLQAQTCFFKAYVDMHNLKIRRMNRSLRQHRRQLLEAQEIAQLGSFEWDMTGKGVSHYTPQVYRILELEHIHEPWDIFANVHPDDAASLKEMVNRTMNGESYYACEYRYHIHGKEKVIWFRGYVESRNGKARRLRGTLMDVTERHALLRELRHNEQLYKEAQNLAHTGNWTYEIRTGKITWSDEIYRICGLEPQCEEITLQRFLEMVHPNDRAMLDEEFRRILLDHHKDYRLRIVRPSGETRVILARARLQRDDTSRRKRWLIGTCQDITREVGMTTELKEREERLEKLNRSLAQKNMELHRSNEELASFNHVASHDLQEPLRKIKTFSDLVLTREHQGLSENGKMWVERISASAIRMQKLIQDFLSFSAAQLKPGAEQEVDLNSIIACIRDSYSELIASGRLVISSGRLPVVKGSCVQLQQLFENLVSNSLKYSKPDAPIRVSIDCDKVEKAFAGPAPEPYIRVSVADNGIGFEQKYAGKIFEIFQRLHGQLNYSGTGIGLAICKRIVNNHNGHIMARGELNKGAVFEVYLPASLVISADPE